MWEVRGTRKPLPPLWVGSAWVAPRCGITRKGGYAGAAPRCGLPEPPPAGWGSAWANLQLYA